MYNATIHSMLYANNLERTNAIMKKTRNLFILTGNPQDVETAMNCIEFKGITILQPKNVSVQNIHEVFSHNKSVVCGCQPPSCFHSIPIGVINDKNSTFREGFINIALEDLAGQFQKIADKLNCDIGDHKSNSSGLFGTPKIADCAYCKYIHHENLYEQSTVYSSDHFYVVPTLGQFIPGYLLIIPYKHVMSNAELDFSTQQELLTVIEDMYCLLRITYNSNNFLVWENGTGNSGRGKAKDSVVHAHTHVAPSMLTAEKIESLSGFHFEKISTEELSKYNLHSYLLIKETENSWRISDNPDTYIPRQYVRQLLADEYGISGEQWNWRTFPFKDEMMQTYHDITNVIRQNWNKLPDRIMENTREHV